MTGHPPEFNSFAGKSAGNAFTSENSAASLHCPANDSTAEGAEVDTITEPTLAEFIANGAVAGITLKETAEGFRVQVSVLWDDQKEYVVITQRTKEIKVWSNLDRLVKHLSRYPNLPPLKLEVRQKNAAGTSRAKKQA